MVQFSQSQKRDTPSFWCAVAVVRTGGASQLLLLRREMVINVPLVEEFLVGTQPWSGVSVMLSDHGASGFGPIHHS